MGGRPPGWTVLGCAALVAATAALAGCSNVSLGQDERPVPLRLGEVTWTAQSDAHHEGLVELLGEAERDWQLVLRVPDDSFRPRRPIDVARLHLNSRIFLLDPDDVEYRARNGTLELSRRGGGLMDAVFAEPGMPVSIELSVTWASWQVTDRRLLGTNRDDGGGIAQSGVE